jgi:hypothetical protein
MIKVWQTLARRAEVHDIQHIHHIFCVDQRSQKQVQQAYEKKLLNVFHPKGIYQIFVDVSPSPTRFYKME